MSDPQFDPIIVDAYEGDSERRQLNWNELAMAGAPWHGVIIKATQGTYYSGGSWLQTNWSAVKAAGRNANRAAEWLRGAYHYLDMAIDGRLQAEYMMRIVGRAGGLDAGDLIAVDVERAGQRRTVTAQQVIDCVSAFADRIFRERGRRPVLYGGSWLAELGIKSRMGCSYLWVARYTPNLPVKAYERIGWDRQSLLMWQYAGVDGNGKSVSLLRRPDGEPYPSAAPGCGAIDCSALVLPGGIAALKYAG